MWCLKLVILGLYVIGSGSDCPNLKTDLSRYRKRRHLTFPDGADFVMTVSGVKAFMTHAPSGWNLVMDLDVLFPLPDAKFTNAQHRKKLHHRQKREFWKRLENALDYHNFHGRACIIRSICEARSFLAPPGKSLVHDLLRVVFTGFMQYGWLVSEITRMRPTTRKKTKLFGKETHAMLPPMEHTDEIVSDEILTETPLSDQSDTIFDRFLLLLYILGTVSCSCMYAGGVTFLCS